MRIIFRVLLIVCASCAGTVFWVSDFVEQPTAALTPTTFKIEPGQTLKPILKEFSKQGLLKRPELVYAWARYHGLGAVRVGTYQIQGGESPADLVRMIHEGRVVTERITIAEGLNRWQIRDQLAATHWIPAEQFDRICDDKKFLEKQGVPFANCEGILFPETYRFARGVSPEAILGKMIETYRQAYRAATANGHGPRNLSEVGLLTLASIVEKETGAAHERSRIACVFYNRLNANPPWRLQTDPTVIYAATLLDPNFDGNIRRSHLREMNHPYNTYLSQGLPPGPIASPGRAALNAVVKPANCADFFFVSKNNGEHIFCPTLSCHNAAVHQWQVQYFRKPR